MKTLITPLGFDTTQMVSFIGKEGISKGDRIIVLKPKGRLDDRGKNAFDEMSKLIAQISSGIIVDEVILDVSNFTLLIEEIAAIFREVEEDISVNISGGVREIIIALTVNCILFRSKISNLYNFSDRFREMKAIELPYLACRIEGNEKMLLDLLAKHGSLFYKDLSKMMETSKSTISRLASDLEFRHLIRTEEIKKEKRIIITLTGRLALQIS